MIVRPGRALLSRRPTREVARVVHEHVRSVRMLPAEHPMGPCYVTGCRSCGYWTRQVAALQERLLEAERRQRTTGDLMCRQPPS